MIISPKYLYYVAWLFAALTFVFAISLPKGYQPTTAIIFILALFFFFQPSQYKLGKSDKALLVSFFSYFLSACCLIFFDAFAIRDFDNPLRFLLALIVLLFLLRSPLLNFEKILWYGVITGSILTFGLACYERFFLGYDRSHGAENPIIFGNIAVLLGLLSLSASLFFYARKQYAMSVLAICACFLGVGASLLSGTRGGWIAIIMVSVFIFWQSHTLIPRKQMIVAISILLCAVLIIGITPQTGVQNRIAQAYSNVVDYQQGQKSTSVGLRFEMWKTALYMFQESPLIGVGEHNSEELRIRLIEQELVHPDVGRFGHAHNEYLDTLALKGVIGLFFLLMAYLAPLKLFLAKAKQYERNWSVKAYAVGGAVIPLCYMDFALTQSMFSHNTGIMMYTFPVVYFWAALRVAERGQLNITAET
ncbi:O-antigen ligase domain-containing protein [Marinomonas agarivorans]|nr:O-antigen ligase domain-containing protein [Marinomonas agarivorans]